MYVYCKNTKELAHKLYNTPTIQSVGPVTQSSSSVLKLKFILREPNNMGKSLLHVGVQFNYIKQKIIITQLKDDNNSEEFFNH